MMEKPCLDDQTIEAFSAGSKTQAELRETYTELNVCNYWERKLK